MKAVCRRAGIRRWPYRRIQCYKSRGIQLNSVSDEVLMMSKTALKRKEPLREHPHPPSVPLLVASEAHLCLHVPVRELHCHGSKVVGLMLMPWQRRPPACLRR